jgi:hypothetical protein
MMRNEVTYEQIITAARSILEDGEARIADAPAPFRATWWPGKPDFRQELLSDYGMPTPLPELEKVFYEEVGAIRKSLKDLDHTPALAAWQNESTGAPRRMMMDLNTQADALGIWDQIAIPVRRRGDLVFRILAPRDVMGSPIVQGLHIDHYIRGVSTKTAEDAARIGRLTEKLNCWRLASLVLGVIVTLLLVWRFAA